MVMIALAYFTCNTCGHRSTAPQSINPIANQMTIHSIIPAVEVITPAAKPGDPPVITYNKGLDNAAAASLKGQLEGKHKGNKITVNTVGNNDQVVTFDPSYATVTFQNQTLLSDSTQITLACPNCGAEVHRVR